MSITNRIAGIAKSYYHSTKEELEDGWEDISKLYEQGELVDEIKKKVSNFQKSYSKDENEELSKEEVDRILNDLKNEHYQNPPSRPKKEVSKLNKAYLRLNVTQDNSLDEVEKAYKKAMKKYHPDRFATQPKKLDSATKVAQMITEAYDIIKKSKK
ncbi:MAG: hypothetical protein COB02_08565 [Candidatus Cloacimonadota bacterium]|nr:MAG: hypothetical protein COB02_08565 [Candidatus Cloacimonadota bacterium]